MHTHTKHTHSPCSGPHRRRKRRRRGSRRDRHAFFAAASHGGRGRRGGGHRHGSGGGGGRRARRGDVRAAILLLLQEETMNGYQLIQEIAARSEDAWKPSPGSVYPALSMLEDEALITSIAQDGKKLFALTDAGQQKAEEIAAKRPTPPWAPQNFHPAQRVEAKVLLKDLAMPLREILKSGSPEQLKAAKEALQTAKRALYRILADDEA